MFYNGHSHDQLTKGKITKSFNDDENSHLNDVRSAPDVIQMIFFVAEEVGFVAVVAVSCFEN